MAQAANSYQTFCIRFKYLNELLSRFLNNFIINDLFEKYLIITTYMLLSFSNADHKQQLRYYHFLNFSMKFGRT